MGRPHHFHDCGGSLQTAARRSGANGAGRLFSAANLESTDQVTNDGGRFLTEKALSFALFHRWRAGETVRRR